MNKLEHNRKQNLNLFDDAELNIGHVNRFETKLENELGKEKKSFPLHLKIAASIVILLGIGSLFIWNEKTGDSSIKTAKTNNIENTIPIDQAEFYYQNELDRQFALIAKNFGDTTSKKMIEESILLIQELKVEYKVLEKELKNTGNYQVATAMIINYKSRITVLEQLISKLNNVHQLKNNKDENTNA